MSATRFGDFQATILTTKKTTASIFRRYRASHAWTTNVLAEEDDRERPSRHTHLEAIRELWISPSRMLVSQLKGICRCKAHEHTDQL